MKHKTGLMTLTYVGLGKQAEFLLKEPFKMEWERKTPRPAGRNRFATEGCSCPRFLTLRSSLRLQATGQFGAHRVTAMGIFGEWHTATLFNTSNFPPHSVGRKVKYVHDVSKSLTISEII